MCFKLHLAALSEQYFNHVKAMHDTLSSNSSWFMDSRAFTEMDVSEVYACSNHGKRLNTSIRRQFYLVNY